VSNVNFKWALHSWKIPLNFVGLTVSYILYAAVNACNYKILQNILVSNKCSWTNTSSLTGMTFSHGFWREKKRRRFVMVMVSDDDRRWVNFSCRLHRLMFRRHGLSMEWCVYVWISLKIWAYNGNARVEKLFVCRTLAASDMWLFNWSKW